MKGVAMLISEDRKEIKGLILEVLMEVMPELLKPIHERLDRIEHRLDKVEYQLGEIRTEHADTRFRLHRLENP